MSQNFMSSGLEDSKKKPGYSSATPFFANRLYVPVEKSAEIVLLDGKSANVYEHDIYIPNDKGARKLKVTCASPEPDPVPNKCRLCNAMIRDERIKRKLVLFLSCIDLSTFQIEGKTFTHTRKLVPLNNQAAKKLLRRSEDMGSLVGARFKIFRTAQTAPVVGDDWEFMERVNLISFFKDSPRIQTIRDYYKKKGTPITAKEALKILISPFDYATELEPTVKKVTYFLGYIGFNDGVETEEEENGGYDYGNMGQGAAAKEEDFGDFEDPEDEEPPAKPKKKKAGKKKKKKKKKKSQ